MDVIYIEKDFEVAVLGDFIKQQLQVDNFDLLILD